MERDFSQSAVGGREIKIFTTILGWTWVIKSRIARVSGSEYGARPE